MALLALGLAFFAAIGTGHASTHANGPSAPDASSDDNTPPPAANASSSSGNSTVANVTALVGDASGTTEVPIPPNTYPIDPRAATSAPSNGTADCDHCAREWKALQASIMHFPLLSPTTDRNGRPTFQTFPIKDPLLVDGKYYYGFRFTVPPRQHDEDFVWTFIYPFFRYSTGWGIVPPNGILYTTDIGTGNYFQDFFVVPISKYKNLPKTQPSFQKGLYLQRLDGKIISDGSTYLIFFESDKIRSPLGMSVAFTFVSLDDTQSDSLSALENVFGLVRKTPPAKKSAPTDNTAVVEKPADDEKPLRSGTLPPSS
jgi:hypothetical protein